jgi:hypothetical protein
MLGVHCTGVNESLAVLTEACRWQLVETLELALSKMPGTREQKATHRFESVYVFNKPDSLNVGK